MDKRGPFLFGSVILSTYELVLLPPLTNEVPTLCCRMKMQILNQRLKLFLTVSTGTSHLLHNTLQVFHLAIMLFGPFCEVIILGSGGWEVVFDLSIIGKRPVCTLIPLLEISELLDLDSREFDLS